MSYVASIAVALFVVVLTPCLQGCGKPTGKQADYVDPKGGSAGARKAQPHEDVQYVIPDEHAAPNQQAEPNEPEIVSVGTYLWWDGNGGEYHGPKIWESHWIPLLDMLIDHAEAIGKPKYYNGFEFRKQFNPETGEMEGETHPDTSEASGVGHNRSRRDFTTEDLRVPFEWCRFDDVYRFFRFFCKGDKDFCTQAIARCKKYLDDHKKVASLIERDGHHLFSTLGSVATVDSFARLGRFRLQLNNAAIKFPLQPSEPRG